MPKDYIDNSSPNVVPFPTPSPWGLLHALENLVDDIPPLSLYLQEDARGLLLGPTSIAYLFLAVSGYHPDLHLRNKSLLQWALEYLDGRQYIYSIRRPNSSRSAL